MMLPDNMLSKDRISSPGQNSGLGCAHKQLRGCRVLVAEDGPDNQQYIEFVLRKAGADAVILDNGQLALERARAAADAGCAFHVILLDMDMPVMDGYRAASLLREDNCKSTVIAVTANALGEDRDKCLTAGCDEYLTKPFSYQEMVDLILRFYTHYDAA